MTESIGEFKDELKRIRIEIYQNGSVADPRLVASWLDRLIISLENICPALEVMDEEITQLAEAEAGPSRPKAMKVKARPKPAKKSKPKRSKAKKAGKRR